jgi:molecular chaperone GrpE
MWPPIAVLAGGTPVTTVPVRDVPVTPGWAVWLPVVVGLGALLVGYAVGRQLRPFGRKEQQPPATERPVPDLAGLAAAEWARAEQGRPWKDQPERPRGDSQATAERARLVASCADLADRLRDQLPSLYAVLTRDLAAVGVTVELANGELFDAGRHNPVGTEPTSDPAADLRVAETVRLGYADHGSVVRPPDVIVYRAAADGHAR